MAHGIEEVALVWQSDLISDCEREVHSDLEETPECGCETLLRELERNLVERMPECQVRDFFKRPDTGWNRSESRFWSFEEHRHRPLVLQSRIIPTQTIWSARKMLQNWRLRVSLLHQIRRENTYVKG